MTPRRLVPLALLALASAGRPATAQPSACEDPDAPWRAPCPGTVVAPPPPPVRSLGDRTHNAIFPNGNVLRSGEVQFQVHELGLYNRAAFGLTDRIELSVGAPLIPVVVTAGARVALAPRESPLRLTAGLGVWSTINDGGDDARVWQATVTAGYQAGSFELHATASHLSPLGDRDAPLTALTAGLSWQTGPKVALIAEIGRLAPLARNPCYGCGDDALSLNGALLAAKLMGESFDTDLGLFLLGDGDSSASVTLPVVSMTYRY